MTATYWDYPPDHELRGYGNGTITLVHPPFRPYARRTRDTPASFAPHDPAHARAFAEAFPTVEAVLEELEPTVAVASSPWTREDLDVVSVGCWGNVIALSDPALADDGLGQALLDATSVLAERYPEARIVGEASVDRGANHVETAIHLPGEPLLHAEYWSNSDSYEFRGDPRALIRAVGIGPEDLAREDIHLDEGVPWGHFGHVLLAPHTPWGWEKLEMSQFLVRHTPEATGHLQDIWLDEP